MSSAAERRRQEFQANIRESAGDRESPLLRTATLPMIENRYDSLIRLKDAFRIPVHLLIADPDQPRNDCDPEELQRLAADLKSRGQLQPIRVRWRSDLQKWMVITGGRRFQAAQLACLTYLDAVEEKADKSAEDILEDQLVENCQRSDLKPVQQAYAYRRLMDRKGYTIEQLASRLNLSIATVGRAISLLKLDPSIQAAVEEGQIAPRSAHEIVMIKDPEIQKEIAQEIIEQNLTYTEVSQKIKRIRTRQPTLTPATRSYRVSRGEVIFKLVGGVDDKSIQLMYRELGKSVKS